VNLSGRPSQARIPLPSLRGGRWRLTDLLDGSGYDRDGDEPVDPGLYVALPPWGAHVLTVAPG
jgi:hypothetical protein